MHAAFSQSEYLLKRKRLSLGGKYQLFGMQADQPLLYVEEKSSWRPLGSAVHVYADESKSQEILTLITSDSDDIEMDVLDAQTGQRIGRFGTSADTWGEVFKDVWSITDADGNPIGKVFEKAAGRSVLREVTGNELPQKMDITLGEVPVGELRQNVKAVGYQLAIDFTMDATGLLDRRMGIATALFVAAHQNKAG
jgi:hypothetical protein